MFIEVCKFPSVDPGDPGGRSLIFFLGDLLKLGLKQKVKCKESKNGVLYWI